MPVRLCVVCRKTGSKEDFIRFVRQRHENVMRIGESVEGPQSSVLEIDVLHDLPGRGAYCHASAACLLSKQVFEKIRYSLEVGSAKKKKGKTVNGSNNESERIQIKAISFEELIKKALRRCDDNFIGTKSQRAALKLKLLESFVEKEFDKVIELRHKRRVRL